MNQLFSLLLKKIEESSLNNVDVSAAESLSGESLREFETVSELINAHILNIT